MNFQDYFEQEVLQILDSGALEDEQIERLQPLYVRVRSQKAVGPGTSGSLERPDFQGNLIVQLCTPDVDLTNRT